MTAFFGVFHLDGTPVDRQAVGWMMRRIAYRGTHHQEVRFNEAGTTAIGAAVNRVTFESQHEVQPLTRDGVTAVGFVYLLERPALLTKLKAAGSAFSDSLHPDRVPDIELILNAYLIWGESCLDHLRGDFALMIWDARSERVFCARDHFGSRVLYYAWLAHPDWGRVLVASTELIAVRLYPQVPSALDQESLGDFLVSGSAIWIDKSKTTFEAVRQLKAHHALRADHKLLDTWSYWEMPATVPMLKLRTEQDYFEHYRQLLTEVFRERMRSDKIAVSMSGGLDSTTIAAIGASLIQRGEINAELRAICAVYDRIMPDTEAYYAGLVARKWNLPIEYFPQDHYGITNPLPIGVHLSQGYVSGSVETTLIASERGKLLLAGDGSDELLIGTPLWDVLRFYPPAEAVSIYLWLWRFQKRRPPLTGLIPYLRLRFDPREHRLRQQLRERAEIRYPVWLNPEFERAYRLRERWEAAFNWQPEQKTPMLQPTVYKRLSQYLSVAVGEVPKGHGFTPNLAMIPYIDIRLVEFAMSLPPQPFNDEKYLLRGAVRGLLPDEVVNRPKTPLGPLVQTLLSQPGMEWLDQWEPLPELAQYVIRERVPHLIGVDLSQVFPQVHMRPLLLNQWLGSYQSMLDDERNGLNVVPGISVPVP